MYICRVDDTLSGGCRSLYKNDYLLLDFELMTFMNSRHYHFSAGDYGDGLLLVRCVLYLGPVDEGPDYCTC